MPRDHSEQDPKYDNWPIEGTTGATGEDSTIGLIGYQRGQPSYPVLYQPDDDAIYQGEIDEENERIVPVEDSARRLESDETLGDVIEELGDEIGWDSLSEFAREHMQDDDRGTDDSDTRA